MYKELVSNKCVRFLIATFDYGGCEEADDETLQYLVAHMTWTHCTMRGGVVRKFMQH